MRIFLIPGLCLAFAACAPAETDAESNDTSSEAAALSCNLRPSSPKGTLIKCTMQHKELKGIGGVPGGVVTRVFGVFIPKNYVPNQSGMILKTLGTTHGIANDCANAPALSELSGWVPFLQTVPSPAPVLVCPEGWFNTGTSDNGERYNTWGLHNATWVNGVVPNDVDFLAQVVTTVQSALQLNRKFMAVTNDWIVYGSVMANNFAAAHPELVSAVVQYRDSTFTATHGSVSGGIIDNSDGSTIPLPKGPVHYLNVAGSIGSGFGAICGKSPSKLLATDDLVAYWAKANKPTSFSYGDPSGNNTKFCTGTFNPTTGVGIQTTLEKLVAHSSTTGKDIAVYKLVGNARGTPICSFNYQGHPDATICDSTNPPIDLQVPPATCLSSHPCNHYLTSPSNHLLGILYNFMLTHKMP